MSEGISINNVSVSLNLNSKAITPKVESDGLQSLPSSFSSGSSSSSENSVAYASPAIDEFAGLGDLSISSDISLEGLGGYQSEYQLPELPGMEKIEASEEAEFQAVGGAAPPGFEGHGASHRPESLEPAAKIHEMAEQFASL